jgi:VanZ family protein
LKKFLLYCIQRMNTTDIVSYFGLSLVSVSLLYMFLRRWESSARIHHPKVKKRWREWSVQYHHFCIIDDMTPIRTESEHKNSMQVLSSLVLFLIIIYYAKQIQFKASICDAIICIQTSRVGKILELLVIYFSLLENIKTLVRRKTITIASKTKCGFYLFMKTLR